MNEPGVAKLGGATPGAGVTAGTNMKMRQQCRNEQLCTGNRNEASNLDTEAAENRTSTAAAESLNQHANQMPTEPIGNQQIEAYMKGLDVGDATAMYELACCCLNNSISDDLVHQIAENTRFRKELCELARKYALGFAEPDSDQEAFQVFEQAEDYNDPDVLCAIGRAYTYGWGVEKNVAKAVEYYTKAVDAGSFEAVQRFVRCNYQHVDEQMKAAFAHFRQLADSGNATALFAVGFCYYFEIGAEYNEDLALQTLANAADRGCTNAMVLLGLLLENERDVDQKAFKPIELYTQAAKLGNSEAQCRLAQCYKFSNGIDEDIKQAMFWFKKAADRGNSNAAWYFANFWHSDTRVYRDEAKAFQYYRQAAIAGCMHGQYQMGYYYRGGIGTHRNYRKAAYWYQKSIDQGDENAAEQLADCVKHVRNASNCVESVNNYYSTKADQIQQSMVLHHQIGFLLAKLAVVNGCADAFTLLGDCYFNGIGIVQDMSAAANSYHQAYQRQPALFNCQRTLNLAMLYAYEFVDGKNQIHGFALLQRANSMFRSEINAISARML